MIYHLKGVSAKCKNKEYEQDNVQLYICIFDDEFGISGEGSMILQYELTPSQSVNSLHIGIECEYNGKL